VFVFHNADYFIIRSCECQEVFEKISISFAILQPIIIG